MTGVVLCGGQSSRMGADKGLLKHEAATWAQIAIDKLKGLTIAVKISVNESQYPAYKTLFNSDALITDNPTLGVKGPLQGVLSVHLAFPAEDLFVLACDMPLMDISLMKELLSSYQAEPSPDACIFSNNRAPEPLCGIFSAKGLSNLLQMLKSGTFTRHSMKYALEHLNTRVIELTEEQKKFFTNFNAHAELNGL